MYIKRYNGSGAVDTIPVPAPKVNKKHKAFEEKVTKPEKKINALEDAIRRKMSTMMRCTQEIIEEQDIMQSKIQELETKSEVTSGTAIPTDSHNTIEASDSERDTAAIGEDNIDTDDRQGASGECAKRSKDQQILTCTLRGTACNIFKFQLLQKR